MQFMAAPTHTCCLTPGSSTPVGLLATARQYMHSFMAFRLVYNACLFKQHLCFMPSTLMGLDNKWIYSFSAWDYQLPNGIQQSSDWRATLTTLSRISSSAAEDGRPCCASCHYHWLPHHNCLQWGVQDKGHKSKRHRWVWMTWYLTCLSCLSLSQLVIFMRCFLLLHHNKRLLCCFPAKTPHCSRPACMGNLAMTE